MTEADRLVALTAKIEAALIFQTEARRQLLEVYRQLRELSGLDDREVDDA